MTHHRACKLFTIGRQGNCECSIIYKTYEHIQKQIQKMAIENHHKPGEQLCAECYTIQRISLNLLGENK